jgi:CRISPR-associated Csx2 family protein
MAQKDVLLLLLGKGQKELGAREYRKTTYFFPPNEERMLSTSFVGEAILYLGPRQFSEVHIFGTVDAMWDNLLLSCVEPGGEGAENALQSAVELERAITARDGKAVGKLLGGVEQVYASAHGLERCGCHLIPLGQTEEEMWETFEEIVEVVQSLGEVRLSIDVTSSLRFHPLFLLLTLRYYQVVRPRAALGSIYYGAFELKELNRGKAPVLDLSPIVEMLRWIDAAQAFRRHADTSLISDLLEESGMGRLADSMSDFTSALQLNLLRNLKPAARKLASRVEASSQDAPPPLKVLEPLILELPRSILRPRSSWAMLTRVARHHLNHSRLALAVIAAWESVIERLAEAYGVQGKTRDLHRRLSMVISKGSKPARALARIDGSLEELLTALRRLRRFRNQLAHAGDQLQAAKLRKEFPVTLGLIDEHLDHHGFDEVARTTPLPRIR